MEYNNYIDGQWINSTDKLEIHSPIDNSLIGVVSLAKKFDVDKAFSAAREAQKRWQEIPLADKEKMLIKVCNILESKKQYLSNILSKEIAKDIVSSEAEISRTIEFIQFTLKTATSINGELYYGGSFSPSSNNKLAMVKREPLGVILAISPFNYPVNLAMSKIIPAIIMGNTVVLKPATVGSIVALEIAKVFDEANIPKGVVNVVVGRGSEIGDYVTMHDEVDLINFTGSTEVGDRIASKVGRIPLIMELGGKDPAIVLEDADLDKTAKMIVSGAFSYSGQRCTAIKRVIVIDKVADELVKLLINNIKNMDRNIIGPLIDTKSADYIEELINDTKTNGGTLLIGGGREGNTIEATLFDDVTEDMRLAWEEPFGPILPVIRVSSMDEAIEIANKSKYGLQAAIFTSNIDKAFMIANKLEAGSVQINNKTERGPDNFPFLGIKASGIGTQGIKESLYSMTRPKVIVINE